MPDTVDKATRSRIMARVRSKDTGPEMVLRRALHARGLRYRLHAPHLPGSPDLVFPRFRSAVFVHGCFWHRHEGCSRATMPATNVAYWERKFAANVRRDGDRQAALLASGWRVGVIWECALRPAAGAEGIAARIERWLKGGGREFTAPRGQPGRGA